MQKAEFNALFLLCGRIVKTVIGTRAHTISSRKFVVQQFHHECGPTIANLGLLDCRLLDMVKVLQDRYIALISWIILQTRSLHGKRVWHTSHNRFVFHRLLDTVKILQDLHNTDIMLFNIGE